MVKPGDKMHLTLVVGARPNFVKMASIVHAIREVPGQQMDFTLVHTGQHYDAKLSEVFFDALGLPQPDLNFGVGSASHARQTAQILVSFEDYLLANQTDCVVVVGDVNSTMACTLAASKLGVPVAHVEAGLESGDFSMPEEINRLVTDSIASFLFCTSEIAVGNLMRRGRKESEIFFVGNTMIDTLVRNLPRTQAPPEASYQAGDYAVCTLHRPSNVDESLQLTSTLETIARVAEVPVLFPVHPRTRHQLSSLGFESEHIHFMEPLGYLEFLHLQKSAKYLITDSGGIQEETTYLGIPCLTLRENTERPETISIGTNELVGRDPDRIEAAIRRVESGQWKTGSVPPLWDGQAGRRIVELLSRSNYS